MSAEGPKAYPVVYDAENGLQYSFQSGYETVPEASVNAISALTGDVTATGPGSVAATIASGAVTAAKLASHSVTPIKISNTATDDFTFPNEVIIQGQSGGGSAILDFFSGAGAYRILGNTGSQALQFYANSSNPLTLQNSVTICNGNLNLTTHPIINVADPTNPQDAATKNYVDTHAGAPAGADTQVQFNDSSVFGGSSKLTFNKSTGDLTLGDNQKLVLGDSGNASLVWDSVALEYRLNDNAITTAAVLASPSALLMYANGGPGAENPSINIGPGGLNVIELSTTGPGEGDVYIDAVGSLTVGKGALADVSAILEVKSTTKGLLFPRMTTTQKNAISNTAGLVVFDTSLGKLCVNSGSGWETITSV